MKSWIPEVYTDSLRRMGQGAVKILLLLQQNSKNVKAQGSFKDPCTLLMIQTHNGCRFRSSSQRLRNWSIGSSRAAGSVTFGQVMLRTCHKNMSIVHSFVISCGPWLPINMSCNLECYNCACRTMLLVRFFSWELCICLEAFCSPWGFPWPDLALSHPRRRLEYWQWANSGFTNVDSRFQ